MFLSTQSRTKDLPAGTVGHMKVRMHCECSALNTSLIVWVLICGMHMDAKPKLGFKCSNLIASMIYSNWTHVHKQYFGITIEAKDTSYADVEAVVNADLSVISTRRGTGMHGTIGK